MSINLTTDCSACVGLCCKAFQFEPGPDFAIHKPAGHGCPNLGSDFTCTIHADRVDQGFSGCLVFDCQGAGQRIVNEVYSDFDWTQNIPVKSDIIDAFRVLREVHRLYELIDVSAALPLNADQTSERTALLNALGHHPVSETWLAGFEQGPLPKRVAQYLQSLKSLLPRP